MIDLITQEIRHLFPGNLQPMDNKYIIHCSEAFLEHFSQAFLKEGFVISPSLAIQGGEIINDKVRFTKILTPTLGHIEMIPDMEQGYKIEKI